MSKKRHYQRTISIQPWNLSLLNLPSHVWTRRPVLSHSHTQPLTLLPYCNDQSLVKNHREIQQCKQPPIEFLWCKCFSRLRKDIAVDSSDCPEKQEAPCELGFVVWSWNIFFLIQAPSSPSSILLYYPPLFVASVPHTSLILVSCPTILCLLAPDSIFSLFSILTTQIHFCILIDGSICFINTTHL